jgi:phosphate starvation-inducible protein PhoH and related proteins
MAKRRKQYQTAEIFDFLPSTKIPTNLTNIKPRNEAQKKYLNYLCNPVINIVFATGPAGTGKTLLAVAQGIKEFRARSFEKIVITRPAVSVDEQHGFLPGTLNDKMEPWMRPITDIMLDYMSQQQIEYFIKKQKIEIVPLAYMRGRTFSHSWVIADEMQNATLEQTKMLLTRFGTGSKFIITGDLKQFDRGYSKNGLADFVSRYNSQPDSISQIEHIKFGSNDIERHPIVKEILQLYQEL